MKMLVVDDHPVVRQAIHGVLKRLRRDAVILEAPNGSQAIETIAGNPDIALVLLDLSLPDRNGLSILDEIRERFPDVATVVLSAVQDSANVRKALERGARGYIPKTAPAEVILHALRLINAGGVYVPPEIMIAEEAGGVASSHSGNNVQSPPAGLGLSGRQRDVLALMMQGKSNKLICRALNLSEATVKNHVTTILRVLKATSRTEAVVNANNLGLKVEPSAKDWLL